MNYYKCGHVMTTHGIKGELKIRNLSDFDRFYKGSVVYILHQNQYEKQIVKSVKTQKDYLLVGFENLDDINLVLKYHDDDIYITSSERNDQLEDDTYYYDDLIGLSVYNQSDEERGKVVEIRKLPQADYLVVLYQDKKVLVPFINEFVIEVSDRIIVQEIEGLF